MKKIKKTLSLRELYDSFDLKNEISYFLFSSIVKDINKQIITRTIEGEKITLYGLGDFFVKKIDRDLSKNVIDFKASTFENGKITKKVYYDDPFYLKFNWRRKKTNVHSKFYNLKIARNNLGTSPGRLLKKANTENKFLHLKYVARDKCNFIQQFDKANNLVNTYLSIQHLLKSNPKFNKSFILEVINNPSRSAYGYYWKML